MGLVGIIADPPPWLPVLEAATPYGYRVDILISSTI